jgi:hypothetical protein
MPEERTQLNERIESFLSHPDAGMLKGDRRMGTELLLDTLADSIIEKGNNVIRIKKHDGLMEYISSNIVSKKKNFILLYVDIGLDETNLIIERYPEAPLFKAKELCHQVPVCYKESISDDRGNFVCTVSR